MPARGLPSSRCSSRSGWRTSEADTVPRSMRTLAILPVKSFPHAKQRLRDGLAADLRSELAETMLYDVLGALSACAVDGVIVITSGPEVAAIAREHGAEVLLDHEQGH